MFEYSEFADMEKFHTGAGCNDSFVIGTAVINTHTFHLSGFVASSSRRRRRRRRIYSYSMIL